MKPVRVVARTLLASAFVRDGYAAFRTPEKSAGWAEPTLKRLHGQLPWLPADPVTFTRVTGAVQMGAAAALAVGTLRRPAAVVLAASLVPDLMASRADGASGTGDPTGDGSAAEGRPRELGTTLAELGGLLLAVVDTEGRPSLSWRATRAARTAKRTGLAASRAASKSAGRVARSGPRW